jgi:anti-sigma-K factor RskA
MTREAPSPADPDERCAELAALYAAGALTAEECAEFERRLADGCTHSRAAWQEYRPVVAALAAAVPPVPPCPSVKQKLLAQASSVPRQPPAGPTAQA